MTARKIAPTPCASRKDPSEFYVLEGSLMMLIRLILPLVRQLSCVLHQDLCWHRLSFQSENICCFKWDRLSRTGTFSRTRFQKVLPRLDLFRSLTQLKTADSPTPPFDSLECGRRSITEGSWHGSSCFRRNFIAIFLQIEWVGQ